MIHPKLSIGFLAAFVAALLSLVPVSATLAGNGGDSEEEGTPSPDKGPGEDGDEATPAPGN